MSELEKGKEQDPNQSKEITQPADGAVPRAIIDDVLGRLKKVRQIRFVPDYPTRRGCLVQSAYDSYESADSAVLRTSQKLCNFSVSSAIFNSSFVGITRIFMCGKNFR